jgi:hypothetical protein
MVLLAADPSVMLVPEWQIIRHNAASEHKADGKQNQRLKRARPVTDNIKLGAGVHRAQSTTAGGWLGVFRSATIKPARMPAATIARARSGRQPR